ncbi:MAG: hypothetical protein GX556_04580 [Fibrobacter sp.]|nr:hypothetical protein [Fibrobacter sp.]
MKALLVVITHLVCVTFAEVPGKLTVSFFGSSTCGECLQLKENLLKPLQSKHKEKLEIVFYDTDVDSSLSHLIKFENSFKVKSSASQMLFFPDTFLSGFDDIMKHGGAMIESRLDKHPQKIQAAAEETDLGEVLKGKAMDWGFFTGSLVAGLTDGINPCAIATMIFLISFMATRKRSRSQILTIGLIYTSTVFITYFAMGLGLKGILEHIKGYHTISSVIRWSAFTFAIGIAAFSFRDAFVFSKTRDSAKIALQLPKPVKLQIHKVISGNLSGKNLIIGSIVCGFLVTILEAICTGQMYLPYIVAMTQRESLRLTGYLYLLFYNFLFVLPLLIVMILAYFGLKWNDLAKSTGKNMVFLKITLGLVMVGLAVYLASGMF